MEYSPIQGDEWGVEIAEAIASANRIPEYVFIIALIPSALGLPEHKVCRGEGSIEAIFARLVAAIVAHSA